MLADLQEVSQRGRSLAGGLAGWRAGRRAGRHEERAGILMCKRMRTVRRSRSRQAKQDEAGDASKNEANIPPGFPARTRRGFHDRSAHCPGRQPTRRQAGTR